MSNMRALELRLVALSGDSVSERSIRLTADKPLIIGRASAQRGLAAARDNAAISNPVISREHAAIRTDVNCQVVFVKDLKSLHGTMLDGRTLKKGEELVVDSGTHLELGSTVVRGLETHQPAKYLLTYELLNPMSSTPAPPDDIKIGYTANDLSDISSCASDDSMASNGPPDSEPTMRRDTTGAPPVGLSWAAYQAELDNTGFAQDHFSDGGSDSDYPEGESNIEDGQFSEPEEEDHEEVFPPDVAGEPYDTWAVCGATMPAPEAESNSLRYLLSEEGVKEAFSDAAACGYPLTSMSPPAHATIPANWQDSFTFRKPQPSTTFSNSIREIVDPPLSANFAPAVPLNKRKADEADLEEGPAIQSKKPSNEAASHSNDKVEDKAAEGDKVVESDTKAEAVDIPDVVEAESTVAVVEVPRKRAKSGIVGRYGGHVASFIVGGVVMFGALAGLPSEYFA